MKCHYDTKYPLSEEEIETNGEEEEEEIRCKFRTIFKL
jgi:hypothetical protein